MDLRATVFAMASGSNQSGQPSAPFLVQMFPLILMVVVFYFILIRPQQKKAREHAEMLKTIKPGDKVLTSSGILGVIVGVKDRSVSLRSGDTKLEILKSAISEITDRNASVSEG
jgi:preprotein translocase subunit YajC